MASLRSPSGGLANPRRCCRTARAFCSLVQPSLRIDFTTSGRLATPKRIYRPAHTFFRIVSASTPLVTRPPSTQKKIGRWEGLYPRIQSTAKHILCGFVCGLRKIAGRSGRNGARSLVPLNRVYTVLTQARTGPPKRSESNESMEHMALMCCLLLLPGISYTAAEG
jgi:hypothetical protein